VAEALLTLRDILVRHGESTVLKLSRLDVQRGEILAIIGPNGAGKSTLLRVMGLLQRPAAGKVFFQGEAVGRDNALVIRRRMASVFQEPLLLNASVYDNAALGLKLRGLGRADIRQRLKPWLERLRISHLSSRRVRTLSGGELQRTSLARALALDPELLLLDEPFSALDPPTRESLLMDLQEILGATGVTTVFVTHDRHEAFMLGSRAGVLREGKLLQLGSSLEVFTRPLDEKVAEIVGADTRIPAVVESSGDGMARVKFDGGVAEVMGAFDHGARVVLCIRPEEITLTRQGREPRGSSSVNRFKVRVLKVIPSTLHCRLALQCGGSLLTALVPRSSFLDLGIKEGDELSASFQTTSVHVIPAGKQ
jgi:tungstate transport system ATP-binding protein